jgi:hypothetical protein
MLAIGVSLTKEILHHSIRMIYASTVTVTGLVLPAPSPSHVNLKLFEPSVIKCRFHK